MRKYLRVKRALFKLLMPHKRGCMAYRVKSGRCRYWEDYLEWCLDEDTEWIVEEWLDDRKYQYFREGCRLLANITEIAIPSLRERVEGPSRNRRHYSVSIETLREQFLKNVEKEKSKTEHWNTFLEIFEDFIKLMKSFRDFNMESLSDFLATNEQHDLWLIVATVKDYRDEPAEDRFSL